MVPDVFARAQAHLTDYLVLIVPCVMECLLLRFWLEGMDYFGIDLLRQVFEVFGPQVAAGPLGTIFPLLISPNLFVLEVITAGRTPGKKLGGLRAVTPPKREWGLPLLGNRVDLLRVVTLVVDTAQR